MPKRKSNRKSSKANKSKDLFDDSDSKDMKEFTSHVNILIFLVFLFGLALAFMFMDLLEMYSEITTEKELIEELKKFYYDSPIGITKEGKINETAFVIARGMSAEYIKQQMGIENDFCVFVVDANDKLLRDEFGNPLYLCTDPDIEDQFT